MRAGAGIAPIAMIAVIALSACLVTIADVVPADGAGAGSASGSGGASSGAASSGNGGVSAADASNCGDMTSDAHNCGRCGHDCLGGACRAGVCQYVTLVAGRTVGYRGDVGGLIVSKGEIFWSVPAVNESSADGSVRRCSAMNCTATMTEIAAQQDPTSIAVDDANVYWTTGGVRATEALGLAPTGEVMVAPRAGGMKTRLANGQSFPYALVVYANVLYWTNRDVNLSLAPPGDLPLMTCAAPACAGGPKAFASSGVDVARGLGVGPSGVYWTDPSVGAIEHCPLAGCPNGKAVVLAPNQNGPMGLGIGGAANDTLVWVNQLEGAVKSCVATACTTPQTIATSQNHPTAIVADKATAYWLNVSATGSLAACPLSGCNGGVPTYLATEVKYPMALAVDETRVYFTDGYGTLLAVAK